ncbi:hypothetical protein FH972_021999 [Carpinus fangiana]|uniref:Uncharacterized protein n=1 Tax=Carpinus fangiana TaxID=176857 RepID=A0A5N6KRH5_9ROSI|nr:hypothetical protein FH972_021999 [Carpinus fangiana]
MRYGKIGYRRWHDSSVSQSGERVRRVEDRERRARIRGARLMMRDRLAWALTDGGAAAVRALGTGRVWPSPVGKSRPGAERLAEERCDKRRILSQAGPLRATITFRSALIRHSSHRLTPPNICLWYMHKMRIGDFLYTRDFRMHPVSLAGTSCPLCPVRSQSRGRFSGVSSPGCNQITFAPNTIPGS